MSLLANLNTDNSIEEEKDSLGGFAPLTTNLYDMVIDMAYMDESSGGALNVNFVFKGKNGEEFKTTEYISSGNAKGKLNYYLDRNGNKRYLPGFSKINAITLLTIGKELTEMETEEKTIPVWNSTEQKQVPTTKEVFMDLIGQEIVLGISEVHENKRVKQGDTYVSTAEIRKFNEISKVFQAHTNLTVAEMKGEKTTGEFANKWVEKNQFNIVDKTTDVKKTPASNGESKPAKTSLFS